MNKWLQIPEIRGQDQHQARERQGRGAQGKGIGNGGWKDGVRQKLPDGNLQDKARLLGPLLLEDRWLREGSSDVVVL